jgi:hypothetical protein
MCTFTFPEDKPISFLEMRSGLKILYNNNIKVTSLIDKLSINACTNVKLPPGCSLETAFLAAHEYYLLGNAYFKFFDNEWRIFCTEEIITIREPQTASSAYYINDIENNTRIELTNLIHLARKCSYSDFCGISVIALGEENEILIPPDDPDFFDVELAKFKMSWEKIAPGTIKLLKKWHRDI